MESGFANEKIACWLFCTLLLSCAPKQVIEEPLDLGYTQNGDLIYRLGNGFFSSFFRDFSTREKLFSHVGIIYRPTNGDSIFVLHAEASELTGIGSVKKDPASSFLQEVDEWAIYRVKVPEAQRREIANLALTQHLKNVPFDAAFDVQDSSAVYCTELVARCVNRALNTELIKQNTRRSNRRFIAIDDTYLVDGIELIQQQINKKQHGK